MRRSLRCALAAILFCAALPSLAQETSKDALDKSAARAAAASSKRRYEAFIEARRAFEAEASAYWHSIADKRRGRNAKRRNNEPSSSTTTC